MPKRSKLAKEYLTGLKVSRMFNEARVYGDKDIITIKNDRDRVRKKPTLYIPDSGAGGALHCIQEVYDNSIDELSVKGSVGKDLGISYDTVTHEVMVTDDGAGIPHGKMLDACTVLSTSGKMDNTENTAYNESAGTYGYGLKLPVFLSKSCSVTSMREGKYLTYEFKDGKLANTLKGKSKEHGTIVRFILDPKFVRIDEMDTKDLQQRVHEKSFCFPDVRITFSITENGKEVKTITYEGNTLLDLLKRMKPDTTPVEIHETRKVQYLKHAADDNVDYKVIVDLALAMSEKALDQDTDAMIVSFANGVKTYNHGEHLDGAKAGFVKYFKEVVIPKLPKKEQDLAITPSDITAGLCGVVAVKLTKPEFAGQHKERLTSPEVNKAVREAVYEALQNMKSSQISQMVEFVKRVTRGRMASKRVRKKDTENAFSKDRSDKYTPITRNMRTISPEIVIAEGRI